MIIHDIRVYKYIPIGAIQYPINNRCSIPTIVSRDSRLDHEYGNQYGIDTAVARKCTNY